MFSSFYMYFSMADDTQRRAPSVEDARWAERASWCIQECQVEQLVTDSKFLRGDSLQELIKVRRHGVYCAKSICQALIYASRIPDANDPSVGPHHEEDSAVFMLELLIRVVLQNR